jgi:multidrug efflux pump subunit AcrA (membrane-fusion protein)
MKISRVWCAFGVCLFGAGLARAQTGVTTAEIERAPLELTMPDRYQLAPVLEPLRKVTLVAPNDGVVRSLSAPIGTTVRDTQEVAELDRGEASARLRIAQAEVKEMQAIARRQSSDEAAQARVEGAQARAALAQLELDRCTLRAPFPGRVLAIPVSAGQFVLRGTPIVEIADTTSLKVLEPVDRRLVARGASVTMRADDKDVTGKVQSIVPLPEPFLVLRELAAPFAAAWVVVSNANGDLEPGTRLRLNTVPVNPVTVVARRAIKKDTTRGDASIVQVLRNQFVTNLPVQVLGDIGPERQQVAGPFHESDVLIVSSSVPLMQGTLVPAGARGRAATAAADSAAGAMPRGGAAVRPSPPAGRTATDASAPY